MIKKIKNVEELARLIEITVPSKIVKDKFHEVYTKIQRRAKIAGFRQGSAPMDLLRAHYGETAKEEVIRDLVPEYFRTAISEAKLEILGDPHIADIELQEEGDLNFTARVDLRPDVRLKSYKGIKLTRRKPKVGDLDVEKVLKSLQEQNAKYISVEDRPVKLGDYIVCDLKGEVEGKSLGPEHKGAWMCVDDKTIIPGLAGQIAGMNRGEEKDIAVTLPKEYPDANYAGGPAAFHIKLEQIKEKKLSEINDEFSKEVGDYENLADLKTKIKNELVAIEEVHIKDEMKNQLQDALLKDNSFKLPSAVVESQLNHMVLDAKKKLAERGMKEEDIAKEENKIKESLKPRAEKQVRLYFIMQKIGELAGIKIAKEDVDARIEALAKAYNKGKNELRDYFEEHELMDSILIELRDEKVIEFLLREANITDVDK